MTFHFVHFSERQMIRKKIFSLVGEKETVKLVFTFFPQISVVSSSYGLIRDFVAAQKFGKQLLW